MTVIYPSRSYKEVCYKGTALYFKGTARNLTFVLTSYLKIDMHVKLCSGVK